MIIEGNENTRHIITATSTAPGTAKEQDAYRSELTGIYHVIYIIETICDKHNIRIGGITAACEGLNEIKKSMNVKSLQPHLGHRQQTHEISSNMVMETREGTFR